MRLVLLDLSMPGLSGEETYDELRKINAEVPVILSSGYGPAEAASHYATLGPAGFLRNPMMRKLSWRRFSDTSAKSRPSTHQTDI